MRSNRPASCANRSRMWTLSMDCLCDTSAFQAGDDVRADMIAEQTTVRDTTTGRVRMNMPNLIDPGVPGIDRERERVKAVSYTHLRAHETPEHLVCRLLLEKK